MNQEQKYLFDLQGYIVLKNIIPKRVIDNCNKVLDRFEDMAPEDRWYLEQLRQKRNFIFPIYWKVT